jgi:hypothetical protein
LPLVVVIGFSCVAALAAWQRSEAIADLTARIENGEPQDATAAVRQLGAITKPPLAILVAASATDERATAEAAQVEVDRLLIKWQTHLEKKRRRHSIGARLSELATELAAHRHEYSSADAPWLASTARKILRIAEACPPKKTPLVALHCDEIFSAAAQNERTPKIATAGIGVGRPAPSDRVPPINVVAADAQQFDLERDFLAYPAPLATKDQWPVAEATAIPPPFPSSHNAGISHLPLVNVPPAAANPDCIIPPIETAPIGHEWSPADGTVRPDWSLPIFRVMPQGTVDASAAIEAPGGVLPMQTLSDANSEEAAETRQLFSRWYEANELDRPTIAEKLADRGFRRLPTRVVKLFLSEDLKDRLRVVDSVLTEPDVDPRPWLLLLAEDEDADVRLMAVSVMATSNDPRLIEAAWEAALSDRDPRIADLAERLKSRRR